MSLFGSTSGGGSLFGSSNTGGSLFGSSNQANTPNKIGSGSLFGAPTSAPSGGSLFGSQTGQQQTNSSSLFQTQQQPQQQFASGGTTQPAIIAVNGKTKVKDIPEALKKKLLKLHEDIHQQRQLAEREPPALDDAANQRTQSLRKLQHDLLKLSNERRTVKHAADGLANIMKEDVRFVEQTRVKLRRKRDGAPIEHSLPSEFVWTFSKRIHERLRSLQRRIVELEDVLYNESTYGSEHLKTSQSGNISIENKMLDDTHASAWMTASAPVPGIHDGGPMVSYNSSRSLTPSQGPSYTSNAYSHPSTPRQRYISHNISQPALASPRTHDDRLSPAVIQRVLRAQHAAILRLAGGSVAAIHDKVEHMRNLLKSVVNPGMSKNDPDFRDPFLLADEAETSKKQREEEKRKQQVQKLQQQYEQQHNGVSAVQPQQGAQPTSQAPAQGQQTQSGGLTGGLFGNTQQPTSGGTFGSFGSSSQPSLLSTSTIAGTNTSSSLFGNTSSAIGTGTGTGTGSLLGTNPTGTSLLGGGSGNTANPGTSLFGGGSGTASTSTGSGLFGTGGGTASSGGGLFSPTNLSVPAGTGLVPQPALGGTGTPGTPRVTRRPRR